MNPRHDKLSKKLAALIAAGLFCILLQAALPLSLEQSVERLMELSPPEQRYLLREAAAGLIPFQLLVAGLAACLGFLICQGPAVGSRWLKAVEDLSGERELLILELLEEKREAAVRRENSENLAHQLRNTAGAGLLLLDAGCPDPERILKILEKIARQTEAYLTESVRSSGESGFRYEHLDLNRIIRQAAASVGKGTIQVQLKDPEGLTMFGDAFWLEEMLRSLLENALDFTSGPITLAAGRNPLDQSCELTILHPGSLGSHIHRRYATQRAGHYGIGLALAAAVAEKHQGSLQIREEKGQVVMEVGLPVLILEI